MRSFIALDINPSNELSSFYFLLKRRYNQYRISWVEPTTFHLTLAFLGEIPERLVDEISFELQNGTKGLSAFQFSLKGFGYFGSLRNPRVLWIGVENNHLLKGLQKVVANGVSNCGIELEKREFSPHLTVGRVKDNVELPGLKKLVEEHSQTFFQHVGVEQFVLYKSELTPLGAVHSVLQEFPLKRA